MTGSCWFDKRKRRKLTRREDHSFGPNHTWHIDGYDKLKPFGIAIHGAIDGYSRRILRFKSSSSNNPKVIANYYLCCIKELNLIPHVVRGDNGTENVTVCGIQRFLRRNHTDSQSNDKSFIYGHSAANQRIESWWSQLFKSMTSWWITFFKGMVVNGLFDISLNLHLQCLRFWFFLVHYPMCLTRSNLFGIVIAFVILKIKIGQVVDQMYFISHPKVQE